MNRGDTAVIVGAIIFITPEARLARKKKIAASNFTVGILLIVIGIILISIDDDYSLSAIINFSIGGFMLLCSALTLYAGHREYKKLKAQENTQNNMNYPSHPDQVYPSHPDQVYPSHPDQFYPSQPNQFYPPQPNQFYPPQSSGYGPQQGAYPPSYPGPPLAQMGANGNQPPPYSNNSFGAPPAQSNGY